MGLCAGPDHIQLNSYQDICFACFWQEDINKASVSMMPVSQEKVTVWSHCV